MTRLRPHLLLTALVLVLALLPAAAQAARDQESTFQDDPLIVYNTPQGTARTLDRLRGLGVDRIRVSVFWKLVAPSAESAQRPGFNAADPGAYPASNWARYDRIVRLAAQRGIAVNFNVTSPVPRWASPQAPKTETGSDIQDTYAPDAAEYGAFVKALGTRYSGAYAGLPRVDYWTIWNEPNQSGWLTPQWSADPRKPKRFVESAPTLYRMLVDAAYGALQQTGHGGDTILIGETAPKGLKNIRGTTRSMDPLRFLRGLYCLDSNLQFFKGAAAQIRGCPVQDPAVSFKRDHPGLFGATGYAHHPYELLLAPTRDPGWRDWVTIANLSDLSRTLRHIYQRYGAPMPTKRGVPLYLTEFGYQTPPDPFGVPFTRQAAYINQSEYIASRNPLVRTMSQFLLNDDKPVPGVNPRKDPASAYKTFQSGLRSQSGRVKPAYRAYRTPIFVPTRHIRRGTRARIWGKVRPAAAAAPQRVRVQTRATGSRRWRTIATRSVSGPAHVLNVRVRVRRTGLLRLAWSDGRRTQVSRSAPISVR